MSAPRYSPANTPPLRRDDESIADYRDRCGWAPYRPDTEGCPCRFCGKQIYEAPPCETERQVERCPAMPGWTPEEEEQFRALERQQTAEAGGRG